MALTREMIEKLAPATVERKAAESGFSADPFLASIQWKSANADNYSGNGTYLWNDYGDLIDAQDLAFGQEYDVRNAEFEQYSVKVREFGDAYTINKAMARSVGPTYEEGQIKVKTAVVKKGLAKRFLFGTGTGEQIKGMKVFADELDRVMDTAVEVLKTGKFTKTIAEDVVKYFNDCMAEMNVTPDTIYCHRTLVPVFETTQMFLNQSTQPLEFQDVKYKQFASMKIVSLDLADFIETEEIDNGDGTTTTNTYSTFYLVKWDEDEGVYGILPPDGKILEVDLANLNDTSVRNPKGNVACVTAFVPYNKRAFIKGKVLTEKVTE